MRRAWLLRTARRQRVDPRPRWSGDASQPAALGGELAERMIGAGARELLERAERAAEVGA